MRSFVRRLDRDLEPHLLAGCRRSASTPHVSRERSTRKTPRPVAASASVVAQARRYRAAVGHRHPDAIAEVLDRQPSAERACKTAFVTSSETSNSMSSITSGTRPQLAQISRVNRRACAAADRSGGNSTDATRGIVPSMRPFFNRTPSHAARSGPTSSLRSCCRALLAPSRGRGGGSRRACWRPRSSSSPTSPRTTPSSSVRSSSGRSSPRSVRKRVMSPRSVSLAVGLAIALGEGRRDLRGARSHRPHA